MTKVTPLPALLHPERSAHASLRGYLYQTCLGVLRWLDLKEGEILLCEGDEDLDRRILGGESVSEQIKAYSGGLGLADEAVVESLRQFLRSYVTLRRNGERRRFLFTTTAYQKRSRKGGLGFDLLQAWREGVRTSSVCDAVRAVMSGGKDWLVEPMAWLDSEPDRWRDFLDAVEWSFDAPDLGKIRADLRQRLAASPTTRALLAEAFIDRLVVEVLEASSRPEVRDRLVSRDDLSRLAEEARRELADWKQSPAAERIRRVFDELDQISRLLHDNATTLPLNPSPSKLLTASYEVIPFEEAGRRGEIETLKDWCDGQDTRSVFLVTGEGGSGKTRLAIEWCRRLRHQGWHAGFLRKDRSKDDLDPLLEGISPRFVVIDYAETRLDVVEPLLYKMGLDRDGGGPKVRLLLLARKSGDWWEALARGTEGHEVEDLLAQSPLPQLVTPLVSEPEERLRGFHAAAQGFALELGRDIPNDSPVPDLNKTDFERALYLHMAALAALDGQPIETAAEALTQTLGHERRFWRNQVEGLGLDKSFQKLVEDSLSQAVAALTLAGGAASETQARALLSRVLNGLQARPDLLETILDCLRQLYGESCNGGGRFLEPLQPDILGEQLVEETLPRTSGLLVRLLEGARAEESYATLTVLTRIAQRRTEAEKWLTEAFHGRLEQLTDIALEVALDTGEPIGKVLALEVKEAGTEEFALRLVDLCEEEPYLRSVYLRELGLASTQRALEFSSEAGPQPSENQQSKKARLYDSQGNRLGELGRLNEALESTLEAVNIRRKLAELRPERYLRALAISLGNLSVRFNNLAKPQEAFSAIQESIQIYIHLVGHYSDIPQDLAGAFVNLSTILNDLGSLKQSLDAARKAVLFYRALVASQPDKFEPDLAISLSNLAYSLNKSNSFNEALDASQEAVQLYRKLVAHRPDAYNTGLAMALTNVANSLDNLERQKESVAPSRETVDIYRQLAIRLPAAFNLDLAKSLNNLAVILEALGQDQEALPIARESVDICRLLATEYPKSFLPYLATSLNTMSNCLSDTGERFLAIQEAIQIYLPFFQLQPTVLRLEMAMLTRNYRMAAEAAGESPDRELLRSIEMASEIGKRSSDT